MAMLGAFLTTSKIVRTDNGNSGAATAPQACDKIPSHKFLQKSSCRRRRLFLAS